MTPTAAPGVKPPRKKRQTTNQSFAIDYLRYLVANLCQPTVEGQPLTLKFNMKKTTELIMAQFPGEYLTVLSLKGVMARQNILQRLQKPKNRRQSRNLLRPRLRLR